MTARVLFTGTWEVLYATGVTESDRILSSPLCEVIYPAVTLRGDLVPISLKTT